MTLAQASPAPIFDYTVDLPDSQHIREHLAYALELWKPRNEFFRQVRAILDGNNGVNAPATTQYQVRVSHTYMLQSVVAEKQARFMLQPDIEAIPNGAGTPARAEATEFENWINAVQYWMELQGDGDVWSRMIADAIPFDMACERIEFSPAAFWPEFTVVVGTDGVAVEKLSTLRPFENEDDYNTYREEYKKLKGVPFRTVYVPPENFLPLYEGPTIVEAFQIEKRTLRSVLSNKMFDTSALRAMTTSRAGGSSITDTRREITIVHHCNLRYHSYWALLPSVTMQTGTPPWPDAQNPDNTSIGTPVLLHHYQHNLGRVIYNVMGGRNGGWKTVNNRIEGVMKGLIQINQDLDEVSSQVLTNIANVYWPSLVAYFDPDYRDIGDGVPKAPKIAPGESLGMWKSEKIEPIFTPTANPVLQWFWGNLVQQHERLSGSAAIFGQKTPGVDNGYQSNLQITQAEHLDDKLEQHFAQAAIQRAMIIIEYVKVSGEKMWVPYQYTNESGKQIGISIALDPAKLRVSMPMLAAQVRKPRPVDYTAALRAALDASTDRHGPGTPLLDDDTIRERILGEKAPDLIEQKVLIQNQKQKLVDSGVIEQKILQRLNLQLMENAGKDANVNAGQVAQADPALLQSLGQQNFQPGPGGGPPPAAQQGGVSPQNVAAMAEGAQQAGQGILPPPAPPPPGPHNTVQIPRSGNTFRSSRFGSGGGGPTGLGQPEQDLGRALGIAAGRR